MLSLERLWIIHEQYGFQVFDRKFLKFLSFCIQTSRHGFSENFTAESLVGNILLLMAKGSSNDM